MAKEFYEIPVHTDYGDVLIHDTAHGNPGRHTCPHAHDVNIPKGVDKTFLDKGKKLTDVEEAAYEDFKKQLQEYDSDYTDGSNKIK